ncbi:hypothetical protein MJO28_010227 [Puccinia striiformis f. sp. tritici]|uniref:Uncharacterized protein n=2 Tax=Puccinia striiformis TaxID=27350 RepID=A0A2S4WMN6_9BASI|nr:hypothetical protein MJO28_010227 [Puccinia striiformis f. sp. tritici]POW23022.1 hypothetical protein PSHT_00621 [Puccinia striiformis]
MATKAQKAQRRRWHNVKKERLLGPKPLKSIKKNTERKETLIVIDSDEDHEDPIILDSDIEDNQPVTINTDDDDDDDEITELQELEIEEMNQANEIMEFAHASLDDNDTTDDEELEDREPLQLLWSIFQKDTNSKLDLPFFQRKLKSGKRGYLKPRENNDPNSCKLIPSKIPRQTEHN